MASNFQAISAWIELFTVEYQGNSSQQPNIRKSIHTQHLIPTQSQILAKPKIHGGEKGLKKNSSELIIVSFTQTSAKSGRKGEEKNKIHRKFALKVKPAWNWTEEKWVIKNVTIQTRKSKNCWIIRKNRKMGLNCIESAL